MLRVHLARTIPDMVAMTYFIPGEILGILHNGPLIFEKEFFYESYFPAWRLVLLTRSLRWLIRASRTVAIRLGFLSVDRRRWKNLNNLHEAWDERTILMSQFIPEGSSVIEFGAGRMVLANHIPESCSYTPADMVDRGSGTLIVDLNTHTFEGIPRYDISVFSGVLEYVRNLPELARKLNKICDTTLVSYAIKKPEDSRVDRLSRGWVNEFTAEEFENIFEKAGFTHREVVAEWQDQLIFMMRSEKSPH